MKKTLVVCLFWLLAVASPVSAQKTDTVPPGFDSKPTPELLDFSLWFGAFPNARYQIAVGYPKQSAYNDSKTGAPTLAMVSVTVVQPQPLIRPWTAPWVHQPDTTKASGLLSTMHAPLQRITFK